MLRSSSSFIFKRRIAEPTTTVGHPRHAPVIRPTPGSPDTLSNMTNPLSPRAPDPVVRSAERSVESSTVTNTTVTAQVQGAPTEAILPPADTDLTDGSYSGVHAVLKNVDYWFEREAAQIEREAMDSAARWAEENLPGLTESRNEVLPPEKVLASKCESLWQAWPQRVKVKMQDAIDAAGDDLTRSVSNGQAAVTEAKAAADELTDAERRIEEIRRATEKERGPVKYDPFVGKGMFWTLAALLVLVEFVANQPVFRIIFPLSRLVEATAKDQIELAATAGMWAGLKLTFVELIMHVEASLLAAVVVILLVVLAEQLGVALRALTALKADDHPFAARSIQSLHRQKKWMLGFTITGTIFIIGFLALSRASAAKVVEKRVQDAQVALRTAESELRQIEAAGIAQQDRLAGARDKQAQLFEELQQKKDQLGFAKTVRDNNAAIFLLNVALVCGAIVLGFLSDRRDITEVQGEHPDLAPLRAKCLACKARVRQYTDEAREHVRTGDGAVSKVNSLIRAKPLATLEAKRARLFGMIPKFRSENARLRGIDPSHILAFQQPVVIELVDISEFVTLTTPETFEAARRDLDRLRGEAIRVERVVDGLQIAAD